MNRSWFKITNSWIAFESQKGKCLKVQFWCNSYGVLYHFTKDEDLDLSCCAYRYQMALLVYVCNSQSTSTLFIQKNIHSFVEITPIHLPIYTVRSSTPISYPLSIFFTLLMALLLLCLLLMFGSVAAQPSPGYYPGSLFSPLRFYQGYSNLWGPQHQSVSQDQYSLTIWLDSSSGSSSLMLLMLSLAYSIHLVVSYCEMNESTGSGFKSTRPYRNGYFAASIKLQSGYTAGVNTAFYVSVEVARLNSWRWKR